MNLAAVLDAVAYVAFLVGVAAYRRFRGDPTRCIRPGNAPSNARPYILGFGALGVLGLALRFRSPAGLVDYYSLRGHIGLQELVGFDRIADSAASILLPALGFAAVLIACREIDRARVAGSWRSNLRLMFTFLAVAAAFSVYGYNRNSLLVPLIALMAAYSLSVRRISIPFLVFLAGTVSAGAISFGIVRAETAREQMGLPPIRIATLGVAINDQVQIYDSAPQFTAFMLDEGRDKRMYLGGTLLASFLSPLPVVGRDVRVDSGSAIYTRDIYGSDVSADQIIPFKGELFWNFWYPGVVVGFFCVGIGVARLDRWFRYSRRALTAFVAQFLGIWLSFLTIGSIAILSQVVFYFMWPVAVHYLIRWVQSRYLRSAT